MTASRTATAAATRTVTPAPLHTVVIPTEHEGGPATVVVRIWTRADASACRLCPLGECRARVGPAVIGRDGKRTPGRVCTVPVEGHVSPSDAPLLSLAAR